VAVASAGPYASLHLAPDRYHASTPALSFLQAGCPSCHPTNGIKALKVLVHSEQGEMPEFFSTVLSAPSTYHFDEIKYT